MKTNNFILVAILVIMLSGCSGFSDNPNSTNLTQNISTEIPTEVSKETQQYSNTETPTHTRTSNSRAPPSYPGSVVGEESVNESKLLKNHIYSLVSRSHGIRTTHEQVSFWSYNGTQLLKGVAKTQANESEYLGKIKSTGFDSTGYFWENETVEFVRNVPNGGWIYKETWYGMYDDPHRTLGSVSYTERLRWVITDLHLKPVQRGYTDNDESRIIFENVNQTGSEKFTNKMSMDELTNFSLRLATRPDGRITNATWRLNGTYNGEPVNRTETWTYKYGVNVSTRPDWLDTARQEAQAIEVTHPTNITYKIEHLGDKTVPAGARISVLTPTATTKVTLEEQFEPTDVIYIAAPNETLETYRTRPSGDQFQPLPSRVSIGILIGPANAMGDSHPESFRWREFLVEEAD